MMDWILVIVVWHNIFYEKKRGLMTPNYVTIVIAKFHTKKSKILQILQLAICQLICNIHDWKYFVILVPASYVNVSENYNLHFAFYIIYFLWLQRQQTNNISIAISFGFQNFSENKLSACVKQNKL
jgi:hypothetical protein